MIQKIFLFGATLFAGLIAGAQYLVWWDYDPAGVSPSFYVEKIQYAIHHGGYPLFALQIVAAMSIVISTVILRRSRPASYFMLAATGLCVAAVLVTAFGNIPQLNIMDTWSVSSPPADWRDVAGKWWMIHNFRFAIQLTTFILTILTCLNNRSLVGNNR